MGSHFLTCGLNHFLAAMRRNSLPEVHQNSSIFMSEPLAWLFNLEAYLAESANWKLSLAGSSKGIIEITWDTASQLAGSNGTSTKMPSPMLYHLLMPTRKLAIDIFSVRAYPSTVSTYVLTNPRLLTAYSELSSKEILSHAYPERLPQNRDDPWLLAG
jgi:hypothetical protein